MINISRRSLFGAVGAVGLGSVAGSVSAAVPAPAKWDRTVDFLVIGSGFAGLAAALEAHGKGLKEVLVLDKMPTAGGNSIINGGVVAAAGTDMQAKAGIKDSADVLYNDILRAGGGLAHPQLARRIADESVANYEWLRDVVKVQFKAVTFHGGHSVPRSHSTMDNRGSGFINPMLAKCKEYGIPVELRTKVDTLVVDNNGAVIGVKARRGYRFGNEKSGRAQFIRARYGVLLASGGFAQNVRMRTDHDPRLTKEFTSTNHPGATGEMIMEAQMIGASTVHMDWIQLGPWTSPDEKGFGLAPLFVEPCVGYGPMIDPATGKRFIKETGNRKVRADAIVAIGHPVIIYSSEKNIMNKVVGKNMTPDMFKRIQESGVVTKYATLKDLADHFKIDYATLKAENDKFNGYMKAKKDPEFDCMFFDDGVPNVDGPFYACRLWPRVHHCMGGLEINEKAQVLNARGEVIPGLMAAGEAAGGVHGMVRLGSVAVADCMIFGRIAARTAVENAQKK